jgi:hypothetical protein
MSERECDSCHQAFMPVGYWSCTYAGNVELWVVAKRDGQPILICSRCLIGVISRSQQDQITRDAAGHPRVMA